MPLHTYDIQSRHNRADLVAELSHELKVATGRELSPSYSEPPDIYMKEGSAPDKLIRVYVVWDKWKGVTEVHRRGIILDGLTAAGLKDEVSRVAVALGYTREEADILGITS